MTPRPIFVALKVNLLLTHHKLTAGNPINIQNEKEIIFVMDDLKDEPEEKPKKGKRKKSKSGNSKGKDVTFKNFGALLNINQFKQGSKLNVGWRCRLWL